MKTFKHFVNENTNVKSVDDALKLAVRRNGMWIRDKANIVVDDIEFQSNNLDSTDPDDYTTRVLDPFRAVTLGEYIAKKKPKTIEVKRVRL